jgi:hypothetical protein
MPIKDLPVELADHASLKDFNDTASLAKSYIETKALVGASLRVPGPDATPEQKKAFIMGLHEKVPQVTFIPETPEERAVVEPLLWNALGRPAKATEYSADGVDMAGVPLDLKVAQEAALKHGLTKAQFVERLKEAVQNHLEHQQALKKNQDALKQEWGAAYEERVAAIVGTALKLENPIEEVESIRQGRLSPAQMKVWWKVTQALGGTGRAVGDQTTAPAKGTPAPGEAKALIEEAMSDPSYRDGTTNPAKHERTMARIKELMPLAYPELVGK